MHTRKYIWIAHHLDKLCVFIPQLRTVVHQLPGLYRTVSRVSDVSQYHCYMNDEPLMSLEEWWMKVLETNSVALNLRCTCDRSRDCVEMFNDYGPIACDRIYRYAASGIYTDVTLDARDQRRLLVLAQTQHLLHDVTMRICVTAYLVLIDESVMRVVQLR